MIIFGNEIGVFNNPIGITVSNDRVYVCDANNDRIQVFDRYGSSLALIGGSGGGDGQFSHPSRIAVDSLGTVFVSDVGADQVQKFTSTGSFLRKWGGRESGTR